MIHSYYNIEEVAVLVVSNLYAFSQTNKIINESAK